MGDRKMFVLLWLCQIPFFCLSFFCHGLSSGQLHVVDSSFPQLPIKINRRKTWARKRAAFFRDDDVNGIWLRLGAHGKSIPDILNEKILSAIVEIKTRLEAVPTVLKRIHELS